MRDKSARSHSASTPIPASLGNSAKSFTPEQLSLHLGEQPLPGSLNDGSIIRGIITDDIRGCNKSRDQVADEMSALCGDRITVRMLNSYTSEASEQHRWPAQYTRAFCHVVGNARLLRCITERSGFHLITDEESELLELGRQFLIRKRADEQIALLEARFHGRGI